MQDQTHNNQTSKQASKQTNKQTSVMQIPELLARSKEYKMKQGHKETEA